jgi:hypothetical protein
MKVCLLRSDKNELENSYMFQQITFLIDCQLESQSLFQIFINLLHLTQVQSIHDQFESNLALN